MAKSYKGLKLENINKAISEWIQALGEEAVVVDHSQLSKVLFNCIGAARSAKGMLLPTKTSEIVEIVKIASRYKIPLYPFSTGHNWGYGTACPVIDGCVLVNLSRMNKILSFDPETGVVCVEPGVTQKILSDFLKANGHPFFVPATGGGPECSILGNAIERGYGITPYADHFAAVMNLKAVLPNGDIYSSMLDRFGGKQVDRVFKWGIGPYMDGLFSQSNLGIVTEMAIALAPLSERIESFKFSVENDEELALAIDKIRLLIQEFGSLISGINLMNKHRMLAIFHPYPKEDVKANQLIPDQVIEKMKKESNLSEWTVFGALYGNKTVVKAIRSEIRKIIKPLGNDLVFFNPDSMKSLYKIVKNIPFIRNTRLVKTLSKLNDSLKIVSGEPSELALSLAYWKSGAFPPEGQIKDPARDGCGIMWFSPLVPMKADQVVDYVNIVTKVCIENSIEPLITLTSLSNRCFDSTVPILFDRDDPEEVKKANLCYFALFEACKKEGFLPYRLGIQSMELLSKENAIPNMLKTVKKAVDPDNIISPGRYL